MEPDNSKNECLVPFFFALHETLTTAAPTSQIREAFND